MLGILLYVLIGVSSSAQTHSKSIGYKYSQVERITVVPHAQLPEPGLFAPAYQAALENRDWFELDRATSKGPMNELDTAGAGRPSEWYVRTDGTVRTEYNAFGSRFTLIFKPRSHELITLNGTKKTYEIADTGDDSYCCTNIAAASKKLATPAPFGPLEFEDLGKRAFDGHDTQAYRLSVKMQSKWPIELQRLDYVSDLPKPPIVPVAGINFFPRVLDALLARDKRVEAPGGLILYRAIRFRQVDLSQAFEKDPSVVHAHDEFDICQRGNIAPLSAAENYLFEIPRDYTEAVLRHRNLRFGDDRETDDFLAFHLCD